MANSNGNREPKEHARGVTVVSQELRVYEEYLAGRIDKETYLSSDSRDLVKTGCADSDAELHDGALWREYQEPADPFANPVTVTQIELPHERGYLRIEDNGDSVKATIWPDNAGGVATDRLRDLRAAVLSAGEWLNRLCDKG